MGQKENKKHLLRLLNVVTGSRRSVKQVTSHWVIDPHGSLTHDTELSGKVPSGNSISVSKYYPLVQYPSGDRLDTGSKKEAR